MIHNINHREEIISALNEEVEALIEWTDQLNKDDFFKSINDKWSTGQQLEHLRKSSNPLVMALKLPKLALKLKVGKANRPSRTFAEVKAKYQAKLAVTEVGPTPYFPDAHNTKSKEEILAGYRTTSEKLGKAIAKWSEADLDHYILPHPLLGKLTVREMLFFTIYHTRHHHDNLIQLYS